MSSDPYTNPEAEYWYNVMRQNEMPLDGMIEHDVDVTSVGRVLLSLANCSSEKEAHEVLKKAVLANVELFHELRKILGISDKRAYLELSYLASRIPHPSKPHSLCGCQPWTMARHTITFFINMIADEKASGVREAAISLIAHYLTNEGLLEAAKSFKGMSEPQLKALFDILIRPHEDQQKAAKRRGHGCEAALAKILKVLNCRIIPEDKASNPMGSRDPHLDRSTLRIVEKARGETFSFDMLILDANEDVRVAVQSLIHTSDPGQYGVDKSNQTVEIAEVFRKANSRRTRPVELWGLLDGIGFSENKEDTLNKMLGCFDYFLQLNTLYKAPLRLHKLGLCHIAAIQFLPPYTEDDIKAIAKLYLPDDVEIFPLGAPASKSLTALQAGRAIVYPEAK